MFVILWLYVWNHALNRSIIIPRASSSSATETSPFFSFALSIIYQNFNISRLEDFMLKFKSWISFKCRLKSIEWILVILKPISCLPAVLSIFCSIISVQTEAFSILLFCQTHCRSIYGLWFFLFRCGQTVRFLSTE